ncbi:hypothetical protein [Acinetobacter junii]|mgnify:CR=1 FL=1|uniref:hypothetical protein n=1 Tax=Acinetobacter junii TaxID=40215 RepID=UPI003213F927
MKDKLLMVVGVGSSKLMQLFFSFYLSYQFDHGVLATFVLIITLAAAMSSIASLGSSPQIVRAGAYIDPVHHIQSTLGTACLVLLLSLIILASYIFLGDHVFLTLGFDKVDYLICTVAVTISFVLYSVIQSYLSYKQKYFALGCFSIFIYLFPFISSVVMSLIIDSPKIIIVNYCLSFLFSSLLIFFVTLKDNINIISSISTVFFECSILRKVVDFLKVATFGFVTMLSLYFAVKYVNLNFNSESTAIYSVSFQFFQIGAFLPSVLGAVFIPKLVKDNNLKDQNKMKRVYMLIALGWLVICSIAFYPVFKLYNFNFNVELILTFLIMQVSVFFSSIQAFYIQNCVVIGNFFLLAIISVVWGGSLLISQNLLPMNVLYSSLSLLIAYVVSNTLFFCVSREK